MTEKSRNVLEVLEKLGNPDYAAHANRFFKAGKGEYGEGDRFLGIRVPVIRKEVKPFAGLPLDETVKLLKSEWHEVRLFALLMLVQAFDKAGEREQARIDLRIANCSIRCSTGNPLKATLAGSATP